MTYQTDSSSVLRDMSSVLRGGIQPLLQLDIVRSLFFLRYATSGSFCLGHDSAPPVVPKKADWSYLLRHDQDLAATLGHACRKLEEINPELEGTLAEVDFAQIERWDKSRQNRILRQLMESVSRLPELKGLAQVGEVYDMLLTMFAEHAGKSGDGVVISVPLARLMVEILDLKNGTRVCDPVCKAGRTLAACAKEAREKHYGIILHGQDPSEQLRAICKTNLLLYGAHDVRVELGDVLHSPRLVDEGRLLRYDRVITAPPVNRDNWGAEEAAKDPFGRFSVVLPKQSADYAYILHCLSILEDGGKAVIVTGRGVLFRQGAEEPIRKMLLEGDHFEAVVGLPGGLFYGTHIPATLLVLRKGRTSRSGKVLFVEARRPDAPRARHEALRPEEIDAIARCVLNFEVVQGMSRVVGLDEIAQHRWVLNPATYVPREIHRAELDLAERIEEIRRLEGERDEAISRVDDLLQQMVEELGL